MTSDAFRLLIEKGDADGVRSALAADPSLANKTISWYLNQPNETDPLHFVSDCICHGWLTNGTEGEIAKALLAHGAALEGSDGREPPLIAAASLGAPKVAKVLIDAGANLERVGLFGARALHWAAWTGDAATVELLVACGALLEHKDTEFRATPLFWAVHGYGPQGPAEKTNQVEAARILIKAGAKVGTTNLNNTPAIELAKACAKQDMYDLLRQSLGS